MIGTMANLPNRREETVLGDAEDKDGCRLRLATSHDIDGLLALASKPHRGLRFSCTNQLPITLNPVVAPISGRLIAG
jgi:hypothetical protein